MPLLIIITDTFYNNICNFYDNIQNVYYILISFLLSGLEEVFPRIKISAKRSWLVTKQSITCTIIRLQTFCELALLDGYFKLSTFRLLRSFIIII